MTTEQLLSEILQLLRQIADTQARIERNMLPRQMYQDGSVQGYEWPSHQQQVRQTIEHLANHPPFTGQDPRPDLPPNYPR